MNELERIRKENEALNEQVKLLVRTEQRLFRTQGERERQLSRIQALGEFALQVSSLATPAEILGRALEVLDDLFQLDNIASLHDDLDRDRVHVIEKRRDGAYEFRWLDTFPPGIEWVRALADTVLVPVRQEGISPKLNELLGALRPSDPATPRCEGAGDSLICMPLRLGTSQTLYGVILGCRHVRTDASYYKEGPDPEHVPFLRLMAAHLERALHNAVLTSTLRERGRELADSNNQLSASLKRLESTQQQLVQGAQDGSHWTACGRCCSRLQQPPHRHPQATASSCVTVCRRAPRSARTWSR